MVVPSIRALVADGLCASAHNFTPVRATLFIEPDAARAGAGRVTLAVAGLDALLERLATEGIEHEPIETYSNGVRHVKVPDPDGNAIALAELPQS
jgi:catechol 2,3-dioxygenase-like lactoylglutathione lyase family enzyme